MAKTPSRLIEIGTRHQSHLQRLVSHNVKAYETFLQDMATNTRMRLSKVEITDFTRARLEKFNLAVADDLREIATGVRSTMTGQITELAAYEAEFEAKSLRQVVEYNFDLPNRRQLNAAVFDTPLASIPGPDRGKLLTGFLKGWEQTTIDRIQGTITGGYYQGRTTPQIIRDVIGTKKMGYRDGEYARAWRNMEGVVRTALNHTATQAREAVWNENKDIVRGVTWTSTLDSKTSDICMSLDGRFFRLDEGPRPPAHPNCRSATVAALDERFAILEQGATRSARDPETGAVSSVPAKQSYYGWLKNQPVDVQDSIIGPKRGKLLRDGGMSVQRFSDLRLGRDFKPLTLKQMAELEPVAFQRAGLSAGVVDVAPVALGEKIREVEGEIRGLGYEKAVALNSEGVKILEKSGDKSSVVFTQEEAELLKGTVFSHNHPSSTSFSKDDIAITIRREIKEMRVTSEKYNYRYIPPPKTKPSDWDRRGGELFINAHEDVRADFMEKINSGEMTIGEANARHNHETMKKFTVLFGGEYKREVVK